MPSAEIEEFAKLLVQHVRDAAIRSSDMRLRPDVQSMVSTRWREAARGGSWNAILTAAIPDIVDDVLFYLLIAIDQELLQLSFVASTGKTTDLCSDGQSELAGWYMGSDNWREMYSSERFVDDLADLKNFDFGDLTDEEDDEEQDEGENG
jgi:hypothetical protein